MSLIGEIINYYKLPSKIRSNLSMYANAHRVVGDLDLYVETSLNGGDDINGDGLTEGTAFLTIQKAIDEVKTFIIDSDATVTINVGAGDYSLTESVVADINQGDNVSIIGADPVTTNLLGIDSVATVGGDWSRNITLDVASVIGMEPGDHMIINKCDLEYLSNKAEMNGTWEIVSTDTTTSRVTVLFDHAYEYWSHTVDAGYNSLNLPHTGVITGSIRVLKTKLIQMVNEPCITVKNNSSITINKIAFDHNDQNLLQNDRHGLLVKSSSLAIVESDVSFRKCYIGCNAHTSSFITISDGVTASTCTNGFMANNNSQIYFGENHSSNSITGFVSSIDSLITSSGRIRSYNNYIGVSCNSNSSSHTALCTARRGCYGIKVSNNSHFRTGDASRFGYNYHGINCQYKGFVEVDYTGINGCSNMSIFCLNGGYVRALSSSIGPPDFNIDTGILSSDGSYIKV